MQENKQAYLAREKIYKKQRWTGCSSFKNYTTNRKYRRRRHNAGSE